MSDKPVKISGSKASKAEIESKTISSTKTEPEDGQSSPNIPITPNPGANPDVSLEEESKRRVSQENEIKSSLSKADFDSKEVAEEGRHLYSTVAFNGSTLQDVRESNEYKYYKDRSIRVHISQRSNGENVDYYYYHDQTTDTKLLYKGDRHVTHVIFRDSYMVNLPISEAARYTPVNMGSGTGNNNNFIWTVYESKTPQGSNAFSLLNDGNRASPRYFSEGDCKTSLADANWTDIEDERGSEVVVFRYPKKGVDSNGNPKLTGDVLVVAYIRTVTVGEIRERPHEDGGRVAVPIAVLGSDGGSGEAEDKEDEDDVPLSVAYINKRFQDKIPIEAPQVYTEELVTELDDGTKRSIVNKWTYTHYKDGSVMVYNHYYNATYYCDVTTSGEVKEYMTVGGVILTSTKAIITDQLLLNIPKRFAEQVVPVNMGCNPNRNIWVAFYNKETQKNTYSYLNSRGTGITGKPYTTRFYCDENQVHHKTTQVSDKGWVDIPDVQHTQPFVFICPPNPNGKRNDTTNNKKMIAVVYAPRVEERAADAADEEEGEDANLSGVGDDHDLHVGGGDDGNDDDDDDDGPESVKKQVDNGKDPKKKSKK